MAAIWQSSARSVRDELIKKSREAVLAAVQTYNNPQITFKSKTFITLSIIAWTYLMHAYYRSKDIEYRYYRKSGQRKQCEKTQGGANKWQSLAMALLLRICAICDSFIRRSRIATHCVAN